MPSVSLTCPGPTPGTRCKEQACPPPGTAVSHWRPRPPDVLCHLPARPSSTYTSPEAVGLLLCTSHQQAMFSQFPPPDKKLYNTYCGRSANQLRFPEAILLSVHTLSYKFHFIYVGCGMRSPALSAPPAGPHAPAPTPRREQGWWHQGGGCDSPSPPPAAPLCSVSTLHNVENHRPRVTAAVAWLC